MPIEQSAVQSGFRLGGLRTALLVALALNVLIVATSPIISRDGIGFIRIAKSLAAAPRATLVAEDQHPGYPALILLGARLLQAISPADEGTCFLLAARAISGLAGLCCVMLVYRMTSVIFAPRAGAAAALLTAVLPLFRLNAADALSDSPHLAAYLLAVVLAVEGFRRDQTRWFAASGAASALAFWIRPEGASVALVVGGLCFWQALRQPGRSWRIAVSRLMAVGGCAVALAAPYVLLSGKITSKKTPWAAPVAVAEVAAEIPPTAAPFAPVASAAPTGVCAGLLIEHPGQDTLPDELPADSAAGRVWNGLFEFCEESFQAYRYLLLLPLLFSQFYLERLVRQWPAFRLLQLQSTVHIGLLAFLYWTAGYLSHRHLMPMVALTMPATAAGLLVFLEEAKSRWDLRRGAGVALTSIIVAAIVVPRYVRPLNENVAPLFAAAAWVRERAQPGDCLLATSQYVSFYSGVPGGLLGFELPDLQAGLQAAPCQGPWAFVVLEVAPRQFKLTADSPLAARYAPVAAWDGSDRRVVVFAPRERLADLDSLRDWQ